MEDQNISQMAQSQGEDVGKSNNIKVISAIIFLVAVLAVSGLYFYNQIKNQPVSEGIGSVEISRSEINADFVNGEKKLQSEVIPPQNIADRFNGAIDLSMKAIESGVPSVESSKDLLEDYFNIATSYSILGNYEKSEEYYLKILASWPDDYKSNLNLGDLYILMQLPQSTANKFYDVLEKHPNDFRVYNKLVDLYLNYSVADDKLEKADKIYQAGIKNAENNMSLYRDYATFLEIHVKDYQKAAEMLKEYQKLSGSEEQKEIDRLQGIIK